MIVIGAAFWDLSTVQNAVRQLAALYHITWSIIKRTYPEQIPHPLELSLVRVREVGSRVSSEMREEKCYQIPLL
jgi:hypothetical protein